MTSGRGGGSSCSCAGLKSKLTGYGRWRGPRSAGEADTPRLLGRPSHQMQNRVRLLLPFFLLSMTLSTSAQDLQRGLRNYQDIMAGQKQLDQLAPQEQQEVLTVHLRVKGAQSKAGKSPECHDARERAESAASELADRARQLRNCAESQNYGEPCSSEFRRVRNAHRDYESAVSSVRSHCN